MLIYEILIFNINLVYLSYKLWITDFNSVIPVYIYSNYLFSFSIYIIYIIFFMLIEKLLINTIR